MGASVGVGALVVGASLLTVFALAMVSFDAQVDASMERLSEQSELDAPEITVVDSTNDVDAITTLSINSGGAGYTGGGTLSATSLDSIVITNGGTGYLSGTLSFTGSCGSMPSGSYTVSGTNVIDTVTISGIGERCTSLTVGTSNAGNGDAVLTAVLASSLGFSATYTESAGQVDSITMVSAGQGFSRTPLITTSGTGTSDATFNVGTGNLLTFNISNDGMDDQRIDHVWFSLDGNDPKQLSTQSYTLWGFPQYTFLFPGETLMVVFDLSSEVDTTPDRVAVTCMGSQSGKAVVENS